MDDKRFIGIFPVEEEAILKIQELKIQGYEADDIYAVAKDENEINMLRGRTDVDVQSADGAETGWVDRFISFLSGEEPVRDALGKMDLSGAEVERYYQAIENGNILLYVDKEYGTLYDSGANIVKPADPNLGPNPLNPPIDSVDPVDDTKDDSYMEEREQVKVQTDTDISQQASMEKQQKEKSDELQTKDNNPYTNPDEDSRY
ncbi:YflT domain-containing protein [Lederbergia lenta]|uniref:General stress protein 17M n=1 Tax=Lederbergia lenta TaxID=1467 RepID=A0A2X4WWT0_LEDLE|nr:general stress protein [Lederbergia lenta]MCM3111822.1 general stress protein [Lederbergia lenta]MEC2322976.1 general stress protein [Lederbergia lenta]SQI62140.1 general stress protein 17M [Lederbergia lenta]